MIKAVLFDFDGVLTLHETGSITTNLYLNQQTGIPMPVLSETFKPYNQELLLGKINYQDIWSEICEKLGNNIEIELLKSAYESTPINSDIQEYAKSLKNKYIIAMTTDNKKERMKYLIDKLNYSLLFDEIFVSSQIGLLKKNIEYFQYVLKQLKVKPNECVFIDNSEKNISIAESVGIHTYFFEFGKTKSIDIQRYIESIKN